MKKFGKIVLGVVGVAAFFGIVSACNSSGGDTTIPASQDAAQAPELAAPVLGDTVDRSGLLLTVRDLREGDDTFGENRCVTVVYENNTDTDATFNTFDWTMQDTEGVKVTTGIFGSENVLGSGSLAPGGRKEGDVCFDTQGSGTPESVLYTGDLFGDDISWSVE